MKKPETILKELRDTFPRRKFSMETLENGKIKISVENAYTYLIISNTSVHVYMGHWSARDNHLHEQVQRAFTEETDLRNTQRKQRSEMRKHIERLKQCDMLNDQNLIFNIENFRDVNYTPAIAIAWAELPETPFAHIRYIRYGLNEYGRKSAHEFRVDLGNRHFFCDTIGEVLNYFDSGEVFKTLDPMTKASDLAYKFPEKKGDLGQVAVRYSEDHLRTLAPYLLMVEAKNFSIVETQLITMLDPLNNPKLDIDRYAILTDAVVEREKRQYMIADCCPELRWKRIYAEG